MSLERFMCLTSDEDGNLNLDPKNDVNCAIRPEMVVFVEEGSTDITFVELEDGTEIHIRGKFDDVFSRLSFVGRLSEVA